MEKDIDVLAVGELNPDLILSGFEDAGPVLGTEQVFDSQRLTLGSSTAIACVLMRRLGLRAAFAGLIGEDEYGAFCRAALEAEGIDLSGLVASGEAETGVTISVSYPGDRLLLTRPGAMARFDASMLDVGLLARARHLHVGSFFLQTALRPDLPDLFAKAQAAGCSVSLDTGWDPSGQWDRAAFDAVLPFVDVIVPNRDELAALSGEAGVEAGCAALHARGAREIALKLGAEGGAVSLAGDGIVTVPGFPVDVVDTTGAGDSFNAGYVVARLAGRPIEERLRLANACGALTASASGGTGGFTSPEAPLALAGLA